MVDVNTVFICGNLTKDPTFKNVGENSLVCEFRIAVNKTWYDKEGRKQKKTCYIDVEAWNNIAAKCRNVLTKGSPVFIQGTIEYDSWTDKNTRTSNSRHYIKAEIINFFGDPRSLNNQKNDSNENQF